VSGRVAGDRARRLEPRRLVGERRYERAGFVTRGEPWDDPEIGPHVAMWRTV